MFQYLRYQHHFSIFSDCVLFPVVWNFDWVCLFMTVDACFERDVMDNWFFLSILELAVQCFVYICAVLSVYLNVDIVIWFVSICHLIQIQTYLTIVFAGYQLILYSKRKERYQRSNHKSKINLTKKKYYEKTHIGNCLRKITYEN